MPEVKNISVDWVEEVPPTRSPSPFDEIVEQVRKTGKVARVEATKTSMVSLSTRLKQRYQDMQVNTRTLPEGYFVFISLKEDES